MQRRMGTPALRHAADGALVALALASAVAGQVGGSGGQPAVPTGGGGLLSDALPNANATGPSDELLAFPDADDPYCTLGYNCSVGGIPASRGVCVQTAGYRTQCWDVCNPKHSPGDYILGREDDEDSAFSSLIAQVRAGLNSYVRCPGRLGMGDMCPPGSLCKGHMLFKFKVPEGRGMCVADENEPNGRACWDMCDPSLDPEDFTVGTAEGAAQRVWQVRQHGGCPSTNWWPWVCVGLLSALLLVCCGWLFVVLFRFGRKRGRSGLSGLGSLKQSLETAAPPEVAGQEFLESSPPPYTPDDDSGPRSISAHEEYRIPDPPGSAYREDDRMPPEPPRELPPPVQAYEEPREVDPRMELFDKIDANHDGKITREEYERFFPGTGVTRIPGLDEPNLLFQNIPPLVVPQTPPQAVPPVNMFFNADPLAGSQPQGLQPFRRAPSASSPGPFQAPLGPVFQTLPPAAAVGGQAPVPPWPGTMSAPPGHPLFGQLPQ